MAEVENHDTSGMDMSAGLPTTHWSLILAAADHNSPTATAAMERLCSVYWRPVYSFIRAKVRNPHLAEDYTQEFFARMLKNHYFDRIDRERGRFRSFLLACVKYFLCNERDRELAAKRDQRLLVSLDALQEEGRAWSEPMDQTTPEQLYDQKWALSLVQQALRSTEELQKQSGKLQEFTVLSAFLPGSTEEVPSYPEVAARLRISEDAARQRVYRLRQDYYRLLHREVADTVSNPAEREVELAYLGHVMGG